MTQAAPGPLTLVGGIGLPWLRDLDFGTQFIRRVEGRDWPSDVVLEDLSYAAHRVLHRLQELQPVKVVLVGAMPREVDPAGTIRRYRLDLTPPPAGEVHERLTEAVGGIIDLDHTLAVVRHWEGFPPDTTVIEVEPADRSFGLGFSDPVEAAVEPVLAMVLQEVRGELAAATAPPEGMPPITGDPGHDAYSVPQT
ncbi:MAG: hydrogenase maturation protease [Actinomycetota bacterium]|nr:hydrogenase maturation protease [Actinomycetota bacterium]